MFLRNRVSGRCIFAAVCYDSVLLILYASCRSIVRCAEYVMMILTSCDSVFVQIYHMYNYDLRHLFTVEPLEVLKRFGLCFVLGGHHSLLMTPDLYGPVVTVVSLPQVYHILGRTI